MPFRRLDVGVATNDLALVLEAKIAQIEAV